MKMPAFLKALKVVVIHSLIFSLLQNSFISSAMAATKSSGGVDASDMLKMANGALDLYSNYLGQKYQMIQQQISAEKNQKLMAQLSPNCRKPNGTACYVTQAKYFPECSLPASMSNMPQNACSANASDPNAIASMITYESIAKGWSNYYEQMSNKNSNLVAPVGLRCLLDKQKAMDSQLTEMMNNLQRLQDRLNQEKQIFRDNNKKLLEEMNTANDELFGQSKSNLALKTRDLSKIFSQGCQGILAKDGGGFGNGLNSLLQGMSSPSRSAANLLANKGPIENDIRREVDKMVSTIKTNGVDDFNKLFSGKDGNTLQAENNSTFAVYGQAMTTQVAKTISEFEVARKRIEKDLSGIKRYTLPSLDSRFSPDMSEFLASANETFKQQFISDCVTGADKGIAIPVDDILRSLEQRATNSEGTARNDYRIALKRILESGDSSQSILEQIKELDKNYPGMSITYKDANQNRVTDTPYSLFMKTADKCEQKYVQGDNKKVERAKAALAELKTLNDSYASKVSSSILNQMLTCNGTTMKSGSCDEKVLSAEGNQNFCLSHASQCASEIQGCYAEVNNHVQTRKVKMENLAKKFNENVSAMITRSNALYEQQKTAVTNMTKLIQQRFPGTNFEIPANMFVSMPELKKETYGVEMAGDGNIASFLEGKDSMPEKINLLKDMFRRQKEAVGRELSEYISGQEQAMEKNISKWDKLAGECKGAIDQASANLAKTNAEGMKRQGEIDSLVNKYCNKYANLKTNPNGACDEAKSLTETMDKILEKGGSGRIANSAANIASQYDSACKATNNEAQQEDWSTKCNDSEVLKKMPKLAAYCDRITPGASGDKAKPSLPLIKLCKDDSTKEEDFMASLIKRLGASDQERLKDVTSLKDAIAKSDSLSDGAAGVLDSFQRLNSEGKPLCATLRGIDSASATSSDLKKVALNKEINALNTKKSKAEKEKNDDEVNAVDGQIDEKRSELNAIDTEKSKIKNMKEALSEATNGLAALTSLPDPKSDDGLKAKLTELGQKMDDDTACDAQNSNSNMPKSTLPWMTDPSGLDRSILGSNSGR